MKDRVFLRKLLALWLGIVLIAACQQTVQQPAEQLYTDFVVDPRQSRIEMFWKDENGEIFRSIENLKNALEKKGRRLRFAMNGGMYQENNHPLGLFIQNGKTLFKLNTRSGSGNFYLSPNGVFYLTSDRRAFIRQTEDFKSLNPGEIEFATQSGPLLVIDKAINPLFDPKSANLHIRNGVCVLDDGTVMFSISRREVSFYDFAGHFQKAGCRNALYLDGFVSRMYLPEKSVAQTDGNFGAIIGIAD